MALGKTYTSDLGALQDQKAKITEDITSQIRGMPAQRQQMAEEQLQKEAVSPIIAEDRGALIKQLFEADKAIASRYKDTSSPMYMENPMQREQAIAGTEGEMWKALSTLNTLSSARRAVMGDTIAQELEMKKADLEAKKAESDALQQAMDTLLKQQQIEGTTEKENATVKRQKDAVSQAFNLINNVDEASKGIVRGQIIGGTEQFLRKKGISTPADWSEKVKNMEVTNSNAAMSLAQAYTGSTLPSNPLIARIFNSLPQLDDTEAERQNKIAGLYQMFAQKADVMGMELPPETLALVEKATKKTYGKTPATQGVPIPDIEEIPEWDEAVDPETGYVEVTM